MHFLERVHLWWERVQEQFRYRWWFPIILLGVALASDYFRGWIMSRLTWEIALNGWGLLSGLVALPIGLAGLLLLLYTALIFAQAYTDTRSRAVPPPEYAVPARPDVENLSRFFSNFPFHLQVMLKEMYRREPTRYLIWNNNTSELALSRMYAVIEAPLEPGYAMLDLHPDVREAMSKMNLG